jgi:archaellum component FlaC
MNDQTIIAVVMTILMALSLLWTIGWSIFVLRKVANKKADETLQDHENRLGKVEVKLADLPKRSASHEDVEKVHKRISDLGRTVNDVASNTSAMNEAIKSIKRLLDKLVDDALEKGRDKK